MQQWMALKEVLEKEIKSSQGSRSWISFCPLFLFMIWCVVFSIFGPFDNAIPLLSFLYYGITHLNTGIHELGHLVFGLLGNQFLMVAGGTILQLFIPTLSFGMFFKQKDFFAMGFALVWLALNYFNISWYIKSVADDTYTFYTLGWLSPEAYSTSSHDWLYLLDVFGVLNFYSPISALVYLVGLLHAFAGIGLMGWVLWIFFSD